jgi:uncharacterized FlgJ-related protein
MKQIERLFFYFTSLYIVFSILVGQLSISEKRYIELNENTFDKLIEVKQQHDSLVFQLSKQKQVNKKLKDSINNILLFNPENVQRFISYYNILHENVVYRQSLLETKYFSSEVFKENNNLFGMKHPYQRATTSLGSKNGHASYNNYIESIKDYKIYQDSYYILFLKEAGYAEDEYYQHKLKNMNIEK